MNERAEKAEGRARAVKEGERAVKEEGERMGEGEVMGRAKEAHDRARRAAKDERGKRNSLRGKGTRR